MTDYTNYLDFLKYCLNTGQSLPENLKMMDWRGMLCFANEQAIMGIIFEGIERSGKEISMPYDLLMDWIGTATQMKRNYFKHEKILVQTHKTLNSVGINHVFMKGLTCGVRYQHPEFRTCGDIDFVVAHEDFNRTLDVLGTIGTVDRELVHEHHGMAFVDGVQLEPHYKVHNFQLKRHDIFMQKMFREVFPKQLHYVEIGKEQIPVFPETFESVFLVSHMVNHVYEEGLGLRQVIDYAMMLKLCNRKIDRAQHEAWLKAMDMKRAHRIFVRICEKYLGLPTGICQYEYTKREKEFADKMMEDILRVGNFGRAAYTFEHNSMKGVLNNYIWVTKRAIRLGYLCPSEAYMWPMAKLTRFFRKKMNPTKFQNIS